MTWHRNNGGGDGAPPKVDGEIRARFRNGETSKWTYTPRQLDWRDRGEPFDIIAWQPQGE
jgi:hypothetical protein